MTIANFARITNDWWLLRFRNFSRVSWVNSWIVMSLVMFSFMKLPICSYCLVFFCLPLNRCPSLLICITKSLQLATDTQINEKAATFSQQVICLIMWEERGWSTHFSLKNLNILNILHSFLKNILISSY